MPAWSGRADMLMDCPGKNSATPFFDISMEEWDSIMEVNLKSVVLACRVFGTPLTQNLDREFAPSRVRVNAIIPGFFPAEQNRKILSPERIESIMRHTPMNRFGDAEELQGAAVYLAS